MRAPKEIPRSESIAGPGLAGYDGSLYDAWTPNIEGSQIDYSVHFLTESTECRYRGVAMADV